MENKSKKYSCVIVDDEIAAIRLIQNKIAKYFENITVLDFVQEPEEAVQVILNNRPDFIFLDISMPRLNGFELLNEFQEINFEIIFTTAHNDYAIKAFEFSAVAYLLKPIVDDLFISSVNNCFQRIDDKSSHKLISSFLNNEKKEEHNKTIAIPTSNGFFIKPINEILRIESESRYAVFYFLDDSKYVSSYNIGKYKEMLKDYDFILTHKSHLVNKIYIKEYVNSGYVILSNDEQVPVSKTLRKAFVAQFRN